MTIYKAANSNLGMGTICGAKVVVGIGILLVAMSGAANGQLIQNGGFESPSIADGTYRTAPATFWSGGAFLDNPNAAGGIPALGFTWPQPADGQQYADIGDIAAYALSQTFAVAAGGVHHIAWSDNTALNILQGYRTAPYSVEIANAANSSVLLANFDSYHLSGSWQARSIDQFLTPGNYKITFTSENVYNGTNTLIDAVQISAVPEIPVYVLFVLGLAGILAQRFRKGAAGKDA